MEKKKMLFVYNPRAGKAQIKGKLSDILEIFEAGGYEVTVRPTLRRGDGTAYVKDREPGYDMVVCSGGDGTLDEVVTGVVESGIQIPIGYIPAGSTNDFGGSLNLPKNMKQAARIAVEGRNFACDVGIFNEDIFVYVAAFGLFTEVSYATDQEIKNVLGHMAYLLEGMKLLTSIKSYRLKVTAGEKVIEDDFIFGMITNSVSVGGFKRITGRNVVLDDGVFEVTLIKLPRTPLELNRLIAALVDRDIDAQSMYCFHASDLVVESSEPLAWTRDGEYGGSHERVHIQNRHKGITIRVESLFQGTEAGRLPS